jgi:hypothetical protein
VVTVTTKEDVNRDGGESSSCSVVQPGQKHSKFEKSNTYNEQKLRVKNGRK